MSPFTCLCTGRCCHLCTFKWEDLAAAGVNLELVEHLSRDGIDAAALASVDRPLAADARSLVADAVEPLIVTHRKGVVDLPGATL